MQYLHCRNCGAKVPVNWAGYQLAGIGICAFAVFGWFSFLFAGSGHAFLISCGIFLIGFILAKEAKSFAHDMKKDGECPKCGQKTLVDEEPPAIPKPDSPKIPEELDSRLRDLLASLEKGETPATRREPAPNRAPAPDFEERLLPAVRKVDSGAVNALIAGKDFHESPETGGKALELAIRTARSNPSGNPDGIYHIIESLFAHGAKAAVSDREFMDCLAPENRDFRLAAILAKHCVNMNEGDMLHAELSTECRPDVVKFMVENGADVNRPYKGYGAKPIQTAMKNDIPWVKRDTLFSVMAYLMEKGADIAAASSVLQELYDWQKFDQIRFAMAYGLDDGDILDLMLDNDIDEDNPQFDIDKELAAYLEGDGGLEPDSYRFRNWKRIGGIPFWHFFWYVPKRYEGLTEETEEIRKMIYDFKDGRDYERVKSLLKIKLLATFGPSLSGMIFLCIPASSKEKSDARYSRFSKEVCEELGMIDGYAHVSFVKEKTPAHLGGTDKAEFAFDEDFFTFENAILFDDVVTRGRSMKEFREKLDDMACNVVCEISIGRTYNDWYQKNEPVHPQTGQEAFREPGDHSGCPF